MFKIITVAAAIGSVQNVNTDQNDRFVVDREHVLSCYEIVSEYVDASVMLIEAKKEDKELLARVLKELKLICGRR